MGTKIQYALLYTWVKLHALLPMPLLYICSDIFYFLAYRVVGYRKKVVRRNMAHAFPEKSKSELRQLEKEFYHHFCDYIVETMKLAHISSEELLRHAYMRNPELVDQLVEEGHTCVIFVMGHYGNWEWFSGISTQFEKARAYNIYRPLTNKAFDKLLIDLRTRFEARGIKKNDTIREMIRLKQEKTPSVVVFLADQTPSKTNIHYWTTFLNQDTPMFTGAERIARKLDLPVVFVDVKKIKRGYYTVDLDLLTKTPKETPEFWITETYARKLEQSILRHPAYWLWTHKRWKYKRSDFEQK
ncbi:KDO2-lipid IV(A) lauroyltransferase [Parabacteroides sp. PFB2-12]|uniref:lysophospholipid acyltransferase family protein n=1 Tax=unclassified Parabacteroides TaxID=2649774 RepID=UPI0024756730|nr:MULTISPECIES: lysophospholipid acyltransferase family protein [unclassified Parabacteroides]MDH6341991.1 KDO2-lipid IV(A) lauroyltransferase [Parabacteroides sp. PM6-13]MDH6389689.1 KDO2-lipid IV(A) lauroyltransferase [Parabacteroides sp. PFB2-12]